MIPGSSIQAMMRVASDEAFYNYTVDRSLRFNDDDSAYLNRTWGATSTAETTWIMSCWVKRGNLGLTLATLLARDSNRYIALGNSANDTITIKFGAERLRTNRVLRDPTAWYHIYVAYDSTQATASDKVRLWVNGVEITSFAVDARSGLALNEVHLNDGSAAHYIGSYDGGTNGKFDGYLAEYHFIDGSASDTYPVTDFGEFSSSSPNVWIPKQVSGVTYGNNGFYLSFADNTSTTTLGYDDAGSNDWTLNNFSVTAGNANDSLTDTPTDNFCVFNPLDISSNASISNGNIEIDGTSSGAFGNLKATWVPSEKFYAEFGFSGTPGSDTRIGMGRAAIAPTSGPSTVYGESTPDSEALVYIANGAIKRNGSNVLSGLPTFTSSDTLQLAYDPATRKMWVGKNNTWMNSGDPEAGTGEVGTLTDGYDYTVVVGCVSTDPTVYANFGQRPFNYTPPTGFVKLSTANLPTPTIQDPTDYFNAVAYTGDGTAIGSGGLAVTGVGHQPDMVWIKNRDATDQHVITDAVRGATNYLSPDGTDVEATAAETLDSFDSDGFTVGSDVQVNTNTENYIAWCWKEGATPGFDIVAYTGNGSGGNTVAHALGVAPEMILVKNRDQADSWAVYHKDNTSSPETDYLILDTNAATADDNTLWNDTAPTDSVFSLGTSHQVNANTEDYIAYLWASVEGFSKVGVYTGNGSADGPFVYCGFRPRWVVIKRLDGAASWYVHDTARSPGNVADGRLYLDLSSAEGTGGSFGVDFLAPGFKVRTSDVGWNASGGTYIFAAFAEMALPYANAR